jgi:hypothetical protein
MTQADPVTETLCSEIPRKMNNAQMLLVLASAVILGFESRRTQDHILLSQIRGALNLEGQIPHL